VEIKGLQIDALDSLLQYAGNVDKQLIEFAPRIDAVRSGVEVLDEKFLQRFDEVILPKLKKRMS